MNTKPLVSIVCLTFNEEEFVRDTFDNFLSQQTSFPFEVLVYDDASQDATPQIIQEYVDKYPDIFKATLYPENNFKKGLGFLGLRVGFQEAQGKYIAYCEGDDYWCDNLKLQKQVDFLESHPEYEVCAHETRIRNDFDKTLDGTLFSSPRYNNFIDRTCRKSYTLEDTLTGNIFHISSLMYRNFHIVWPEWIAEVKALDMVLFMILAERGNMYVLQDVMSVYRHNKKSITSTQEQFNSRINSTNMLINLLLRMDLFWNRKYHNNFAKQLAVFYANNFFIYLKKSTRSYKMACVMLYRAFTQNFCYTSKLFIIGTYKIIRGKIAVL